MKKHLLLLLTAVCLLLPGAAFPDGDERLVLVMAEQALTNKDTLKARNMLDKIATQCEGSDSWTVRFKFYSLRGYLNSLDPQNLTQAIDDLQSAYSAFPDTVPPTSEYLMVAYYLCQVYYDSKHYSEGERVAEKSLLRASAIAEDCLASENLFYLLAKFYEQRGDTIMPPHFHRKSQEVAVKRFYKSLIPADSLPIYYKQLKDLFNHIDNNKPRFSREYPEYLFFLDELSFYVKQSGNVQETIYLSEYILQTARDSMLLDFPDFTFYVYVNLIYAYAVENKIDQALALLPEADEYYSHHPNSDVTKSLLYYEIGLGLFNCKTKQTEKVVHYLKLAKEGLSEKDYMAYIEKINTTLALCEEN